MCVKLGQRGGCEGAETGDENEYPGQINRKEISGKARTERRKMAVPSVFLVSITIIEQC